MRRAKKLPLKKLPLAEFQKIKQRLIDRLRGAGPFNVGYTHHDFVADYNDALQLLKKGLATKMQIVRFKQLIKKAAQGISFYRSTGD